MSGYIKIHDLAEVVDDEGNKTLRMEVTLKDAEEAKWFSQSLRELAEEVRRIRWVNGKAAHGKVSK